MLANRQPASGLQSDPKETGDVNGRDQETRDERPDVAHGVQQLSADDWRGYSAGSRLQHSETFDDRSNQDVGSNTM